MPVATHVCANGDGPQRHLVPWEQVARERRGKNNHRQSRAATRRAIVTGSRGSPCLTNSAPFGNLLPPQAPPVPADEDPQFGMPAIRELRVGVEVEEAVVAAVFLPELHQRMGSQDGPVHHVLPLQPLLAVDLFRLGSGNLVLRRHEVGTYSPPAVPSRLVGP